MKKILFVASESVPFIKTGGLADVVGSLPKNFNKDEYDCRVIIPKYQCMNENFKNQLQYVTHFYMDLAWRSQYVGILKMEYDGSGCNQKPGQNRLDLLMKCLEI